jgi:hypothetical protein
VRGWVGVRKGERRAGRIPGSGKRDANAS